MTTRTRLIPIVLTLSMALPASLVAAATDRPSDDAVTFYEDVLPILQHSCQSCHRPQGRNLGGMIAPMSLMTYEETRPWAKSIARVVDGGYMPPWHASPEQNGAFANERTLTPQEIATLVRWGRTGARTGDPAAAPEPVEFASYEGWSIGRPDLVVRLPEPFFVDDDVEDLYVTLETQLTEEQLPEDRWIKAVEFRPGSRVVHHIIARPIGGIAPGYEPSVYRDGYSRLLKKGSVVRFRMHYHKERGPGTGVWDQSEVAIKFWEPGSEIRHVVKTEPLGNFDFRIPPGESNYLAEASHTFEKDALILAFNPHMHLRGKAAKYIAVYPDGREEVLLHVPQYDFNWQTTYTYKEPKLAPAGTRIDLSLWWDNSDDNPDNPDPTKTVTWGRPTTAEMGFGWMRYVDADPASILVQGPAKGPETTGGR